LIGLHVCMTRDVNGSGSPVSQVGYGRVGSGFRKLWIVGSGGKF